MYDTRTALIGRFFDQEKNINPFYRQSARLSPSLAGT